MNIKRRFGVVPAVALLFLVLGCSGESASVITPKGTEAAEGIVTAPAEPPDAQPPEAIVSEPNNGEAVPDEKEKNNISVASPQTEVIDPNDDSDEQDKDRMTAGKPPARSYDAAGAFDSKLPTLMDIAIGDDKGIVSELFGPPRETFSLPDEAVEAAVYVYPGFSVGIQDGRVLFVEVNTRSVNPGLSGFRLGDSEAAALKILGEPTSRTEYVLNYAGGGTILKMDTDPDTKQIHSIKLFPEE